MPLKLNWKREMSPSGVCSQCCGDSIWVERSRIGWEGDPGPVLQRSSQYQTYVYTFKLSVCVILHLGKVIDDLDVAQNNPKNGEREECAPVWSFSFAPRMEIPEDQMRYS